MNYCLECGNTLSQEPQMVVPLETVDFSNSEKPSEQVTENYEKETVVNSRFAVQPGVQTFHDQSSQGTGGSNTKLFLLVGGGLFALVMLIGVAAAGFVFYAIKNQEKPPSRPVVSNTPEKTPVVENSPDIIVNKTPDLTPEVEETPDTTEETITFPTPENPTKSADYEIRSVLGWQLSDIETVPNENFTIKVSGRIDLDGIKDNVSVKGVKGFEERRVIEKFPTGALLMRTHYPDGRHSNIQAVSASQYWQNYKDETGKIEFLINDNSPENNSGEFIISFKMTDVPQAKN
jgi:hypothetical protein